MASKTCTSCQKTFEITPQEQTLYKKFGFPEGELCFECDQKSRICFRNGRNLYQRKCDASGQNIISSYSPDKPYKIYKSDIWYGDSWDALEYGRDYDFNRPFFEQFADLQLVVPRLGLSNVNGENSDYCNMTVYNKNCYLVFGGDYNQDVQYGDLCMHNRDSFDIDYSNHNEACYFLSDSFNCYGCSFTFDSKNCNDCHFVSDCTGCSECILCTSLTKKSYCILNQEYSKEEYEEKKKALLDGSYKTQQEHWQKFLDLRAKRIVKFSHQISCENCSGDYIENSKNCHNVFETSDSEDTANIIYGTKNKDCFCSSLIGHGSEVCFQMQSTFTCTNSVCSYFVVDSSNVAYCDMLIGCHDCFGCVGLRHKRHCILNKQYSKEEYEKLRAQIVEQMKTPQGGAGGDWGKFFPHHLSCFGYNESTAQEYFPMTKEEALAQGFKWSDYPEKKPEAAKTITADQLSDSVIEISDEILNWAIECPVSGRLFKITAPEFKFYQRNNLPLPRLHPDERHRQRTGLRTPRQLWSRTCAKCDTEIQTTYSPDRPETVYCEACYLKTVY